MDGPVKNLSKHDPEDHGHASNRQLLTDWSNLLNLSKQNPTYSITDYIVTSTTRPT